MKNWYKSAPMKGLLFLLEHAGVAVLAICFLWLVKYSGFSSEVILQDKNLPYAQTERLGKKMLSDSVDIMSMQAAKKDLETEGRLDRNKIVDVKELAEEGSISGKNKSGLAYQLGKLEEWDNQLSEGIEGGEDSIIVCQKPEGGYAYYYYGEFQKLVETGELAFVIDPDYGISSAEALDYLRDGTIYYPGEDPIDAVVDKENQVLYRGIWNYDGFQIAEFFQPEGAENILEVVNKSEEWNGNLEMAFQYISLCMENVRAKLETYQTMEDTWEEGNTNLTYIYADTAKKQIYTNCAGYGKYDELEDNIAEMKQAGAYVVVRPTLGEFESDVAGTAAYEWTHSITQGGPAGEAFVYAVSVDTAYPIQDSYYEADQLYQQYAPKMKNVLLAGIVSAVLILIAVVWLTITAGRSAKDGKLHLNVFDRIKTEIAAAISIGGGVVAMILAASAWGRAFYNYTGSNYPYLENVTVNLSDMILMAAGGILVCAVFMAAYLSLVRRIKAGTLWENSLLKWFVGFLKKIGQHVDEVWKIGAAIAGILLLHLLLMATGGHPVFAVLTLVVDFAAAVYLFHMTVERNKISKGIDRIAAGEVSYKIPLDGMRGAQREIADKINSIGEGLDAAVENSIKNERLKTDLITNVSHDIKTPLTSIINYVDLLKRENFEDPKIRNYLDILEAKAQRLKVLTEDVVEASKVSSGNIALEYMSINLVEMIQQTSGEFVEKFSRRNLKEVLSLPEEEAIIRVDGRRMWRVLENIYNNAAKYAMEGTRVYADLQIEKTTVTFTLKNISENPLNISAEELTERFIRGDVSRSTEGSGLGLSIAKSLTEMQGGVFRLYLDGDLFKVMITFPRVEKTASEEK